MKLVFIQRMEDENLERRFIIWKSPDFPHLDETELRNITCGVYQLKLSSSYMQEYLEVNSEIFVHQEDDTRSVTESPHIIQDIFVIDRVHPNGSYRMVLVGSHSSIALWSLSVSSITLLASSKCSPIPDTCGLCLAYPRYHKMDAM
jgi:hypothetical protein